MTNLTRADAARELRYEPKTGALWWIKSKSGRDQSKPAGHVGSAGYIVLIIGGKVYKAHRIAWLLVTGEWPSAAVDHINGKRDDNRWQNLRAATDGENQQNRKKQKNNSSGFMGVSFIARDRRWKAEISCRGKKKHLGCFASPELAHQAYLRAKQELHTFQPTPRT